MSFLGKQYPRIFSISTVGIRNHNNADFLIHPVRTDFTGQSGTGKSMIGADIPQLILTAGRFYKSSTKPKGDVSRDYNSLPLSKLDFGYAFMNIEVSKDKFIAIGVMIRRSPKQLHPFIIQGNLGLHSENNPNFRPLDKIIRQSDFISNGEILALDSLKDLLENQQIYLTSYFNNIHNYHRLLFVNKILHLDLSLDENLQRQYAHTLQSLSRGEDIDTTGAKFKKFLFHYDNEVSDKFKAQAKSIEEDHLRFQKNWEAHSVLTKKKEILLGVLKSKKKKIAAYEQRLSKETQYYYVHAQQKTLDLKKCIEQYYETELDILILSERKISISLTTINDEIIKLLRSHKNEREIYKNAKNVIDGLNKELETNEEIIKPLEKEKDTLKEQFDKIEEVFVWLKSYKTVDKIREEFHRQLHILSLKEKLNRLNRFLENEKLLNEFEESKYSKSVKPAIEYYSLRTKEIKAEIKNIEKLKEIISNQDTESFVGWAVREGSMLNELQEAVLFHFATFPTVFSDTNYIPNPKFFIDSLKQAQETETSFVINLSGLFYYIPKRPEYIFKDPATLMKEIERIGLDFQSKINQLEDELKSIENLDKLFGDSLSYSEEYLNAYLNQNEINQFVIDETLKLTEEQFETRLALYESDEIAPKEVKIKTKFEKSLEEYKDKLGVLNTGQERLRKNKQELSAALERTKEIRGNYKTKILSRIALTKKERENEAELLLWRFGIKLELNGIKEQIENPFSTKLDVTIQKYRIKYKNENDIDSLQDSVLRENKGGLKNQIANLKDTLPNLQSKYETKKAEYIQYFKTEFIPTDEVITIEALNGSNGYITVEGTTTQDYETKYSEVLEAFKEELTNNPRLKKHMYDFNLLILELIPPEIISNKDNPEASLQTDIEEKLLELHYKINELNKEETKKLYNIVKELKSIVGQQTSHLDSVKALLRDFKLASYHRVSLTWNYSTDFNIKWVDALNNDIENLNFENSLFGEKSNINAHELLEQAFKKYHPNANNAKASEILNPFNYYDASAKIIDPNDNPSPGSAGQNYGMLALLCIAKLSIVEGKTRNVFDKIELGIRILPIDEVAGLGENFDMLYEIAQRMDYQIFTMTITANDLMFENGKQIYYEFIKNSNEKLFDYNEGVQACFSKNNIIADIETHFADSVFDLQMIKSNDTN